MGVELFTPVVRQYLCLSGLNMHETRPEDKYYLVVKEDLAQFGFKHFAYLMGYHFYGNVKMFGKGVTAEYYQDRGQLKDSCKLSFSLENYFKNWWLIKSLVSDLELDPNIQEALVRCNFKLNPRV